MTKSTITREQLLEIIETDHVQCGEASYLASMSLAAMDQKPALHRYRRKAVEPYGPYPWHYEVFVDYPQPFEDIEDEYFYAAPPVVTGFAVDGESECLPLDYLQGHKDGLEWAAQLAEANHPETGDWLYDDPIELAKAIRKGPYMPPVQPAADSEQVAEITEDLGRLFVKIHYPTTLRAGDKLYRHAQPAPVSYSDFEEFWSAYIHPLAQDDELKGFSWGIWNACVSNSQPAPVVPEEMPCGGAADDYHDGYQDGWNACRADTLEAAPQSPGSKSATVPGKWIPVSERMPDENAEQQVLACFKGGDISTLYYLEGRWDDAYGIVPIRQDVTHWMPLPAAPQEVKDGK